MRPTAVRPAAATRCWRASAAPSWRPRPPPPWCCGPAASSMAPTRTILFPSPRRRRCGRTRTSPPLGCWPRWNAWCSTRRALPASRGQHRLTRLHTRPAAATGGAARSFCAALRSGRRRGAPSCRGCCRRPRSRRCAATTLRCRAWTRPTRPARWCWRPAASARPAGRQATPLPPPWPPPGGTCPRVSTWAGSRFAAATSTGARPPDSRWLPHSPSHAASAGHAAHPREEEPAGCYECQGGRGKRANNDGGAHEPCQGGRGKRANNDVGASMTRELAIDLGTANTLVYVKGQGVRLTQPTVIALNERTSEILAMGDEAYAMIGRTPGHIVAVRPLRGGASSDFDTTARLIRLLLRRVGARRLSKPRVVICVPSAITPVERRAVQEATLEAGAKVAYLLEEPMAAAIGADLPVLEPAGSLIVDVGGGTTEVG